MGWAGFLVQKASCPSSNPQNPDGILVGFLAWAGLDFSYKKHPVHPLILKILMGFWWVFGMGWAGFLAQKTSCPSSNPQNPDPAFDAPKH